LVFGHPGGAFFTLEVAASESDRVRLIYTDSSADLALPATRDAVSFLGEDALIQYPLPRSLEGTRAFESHGGATATAGRCEEGGITRWCGAPRVASHLAYSPDSHSLMFEGPSGVLWLGDMSEQPSPEAARPLTSFVPTCTVSCKGETYAFAP
jgi:hypothetical protein